MKHAMQNIGWTLAGLFALAAALISFRWVAVFFLAIWLITVAFRPALRNQWSIAAILIGFIVCCFQPFDISFKTRRGPPRIVPAYYGKLSQKMWKEVERGEAVHNGGCDASDFEPTWVLVW
jgi:hypothetical protein